MIQVIALIALGVSVAHAQPVTQPSILKIALVAHEYTEARGHQNIPLVSLNPTLAKLGMATFPVSITLNSRRAIHQYLTYAGYLRQVNAMLKRELEIPGSATTKADFEQAPPLCYVDSPLGVAAAMQALQGSIFSPYSSIRAVRFDPKTKIVLIISDYGQQGDGTERVFTRIGRCPAGN